MFWNALNKLIFVVSRSMSYRKINTRYHISKFQKLSKFSIRISMMILRVSEFTPFPEVNSDTKTCLASIDLLIRFLQKLAIFFL